MNQTYPLKIDAYARIMPPKYEESLYKVAPKSQYLYCPSLHDLEQRFRIMDRFEGIVQVLTISLPKLWCPVSRQRKMGWLGI